MAAGDPGTRKRNYSATAIETTLVNSITSAATGDTTTSVAVVSVSGFPGTVPFTLILQPDTNKEEVVTVTAIAGTTLTITRGQDLTQAVAHSAGASVRHGISAREFKELQTHIAARGYDADSSILSGVDSHVHGLASGDGSVVGSDQSVTLTRKTLTTPTVNGATLTGTVTATTATIASPTITSPTISGSPVITGLSSAGMSTSSAAPKSYVDALITSNAAYATAAATSATSAATSATSAATSASSALTSQTAAATSATSAAASATAAATSATSAAASATAAAASTSAAAVSATSAAASATAAATSATSAAASATTASGSAATAVTNATNAATSATSAATSATSAAASATAAANSVSTIAGYATTASNSAAAAATSATSAATSATSAATSATSAAASYTAIVDQTGKGLVRDMGSIADTDTTTDTYISITTQVTQATAQATAAATSATSAATSATSAAASVTSATAQATAATTSATSAANSATAATTSATSAANSATAATTSAASAATSASSAATSASTAAAAASAAVSGKLDKSGGTMTGNLILNADPSTGLGAATKQYVDLITAGVNFHAPVKAASVTNLSVIYNNGTSGVGATLTADTNRAFSTLDGQSVSVGERVLIKDQTTQLQNGIYTLTTVGSGSVPWVITRATDQDNSIPGEMANGDVIFAIGGSTNSGKTFVNSTVGTITIGTTSIVYSAYYAGLPAQTGSAGYFLTTDGTTPSWASLSDWGTV
jgi:hypothetical protein